MKRTTVSERALVLAPRGRDAQIATGMLQQAGVDAVACPALGPLIQELDHGAGLVVITEEAIDTANLHPLSAWLADQEEWSDLPFILLTSRGGGLERNPSAVRNLEILGNVTFLERPFHPTTLVSLAQAALRGRRRQYEARSRLAALHESEERLRFAVDGADVGFWDVDVINDVLIWPPRTKAMFGISPDAAVSMADFYNGLHPDDQKATSAAFAAAVDPSQRATYDVEYRTIGKEDGILRWVAAKGRGVFDADGRCIRVAGTAIDISARRLAGEQLRASEEFNRRILQSSSDCIKVLDLDGRLEFMSEGGMETMEVDDFGAVRGALWLDLWGDDEKPQVAGALELARRGEAGRFQAFARTMKGSPRWWDVAVTAIRDADGRPEKLLSISRDITSAKEAETQLRELNTTLERRVVAAVAEREAALAQLHEAQKLETLGQLTGGVAHDFNNLLMPITGALDMIGRRYTDDPRAVRLIDGALQSAERAKILVERLLGFARRQALETRATDLGDLVESMRDLIASSIGPAIDLRLDVRDDLPAALVDPNQLELAVLNLCVNARDAMTSGGRLTVAVDRAVLGPAEGSSLSPGVYLRLSVIDTGAGMDAETLARAVEPFFSTKEVGRGTGLGLSMVHGFAAQLGGVFKLTSALGQGTRADIYLPSARAEARAAPAPSNKVMLGAARPLSILLVDDEDLVRTGTAEMLRELGHSVAEAEGGAQALALFAAGLQVDAVLTDYLMPRMDGAELARRIREQHPALPILVITGYAGGDLEIGLPKLSKPFRQADLGAALARLTQPPDNVVQLPRRNR